MRAILVLTVLLSGCAPHKAQLRTLLGECRAQNREHVRMLKEYEQRDENWQQSSSIGTNCRWEKRACNTCLVCGNVESCTVMGCNAPEQTLGASEFGLGGW